MSIFHYNIAAIIILIVVMLSLKNKNVKTKSAKTYMLVLTSSVLATLLSFISSVIINFNDVNLNIIRTIEALFLCFFNLSYIFYINYIICLDQKNKNKVLKILMFIMVLLVVTISCLSIINPNIIKIDLNSKIINGIGYYVLYGLAGFYLLIMLGIVIFRFKQIKLKNSLPVLFYIFMHLISIILEIYYKHVKLENLNILSFANSISILVVFISLENPNYYVDSTTNAMNSITFYDEVDKLINYNKKFEIVSMYFQDLKMIIGKVGYEAFNEIQKEISLRLKKNYSRSLYYLSDYQFVVITNDSKSFLKLKTEGIEIEKYELVVKPKVSVFQVPKNVKTRDEIVKMLSHVKDKDTSKDAIEKVQREIKVEEYLRKCIEEKSFIVNFQPIYNIRKQRFKSAEVLVRMPNNLAFPDEFIPLSEKLGLINKVDEIIMEKAFKFIRSNNLDQVLDRIEINLSPVECLNKNLSKRILKLLDKYKINPSFLNLEILETSEILENEVFINNINQLKSKGVGLSLDDFGTGYSNIINMTNYPYNIIKIDKSILYNAENSKKAKDLFINLTKLIFSMQYDIIIEGVETVEQFNLCKSLGINLIQGYYFSKPLAMNDFLIKINENA